MCLLLHFQYDRFYRIFSSWATCLILMSNHISQETVILLSIILCIIYNSLLESQHKFKIWFYNGRCQIFLGLMMNKAIIHVWSIQLHVLYSFFSFFSVTYATVKQNIKIVSKKFESNIFSFLILFRFRYDIAILSISILFLYDNTDRNFSVGVQP